MLRDGISAHALVSTLGHYVNLRFVRGGWLMPLQLEMEDRWFWLCSSHDDQYHFVVHFEFCRTYCQMAFHVFLSFIRKDGSFATFWYVYNVEQSSRWRDTEHPKHRQNTEPTIEKRKSIIKSLVFRQWVHQSSRDGRSVYSHSGPEWKPARGHLSRPLNIAVIQ